MIGVVVIGRNEGERLRKCLNSVSRHSDYVVYVDSGSTDESLDIAEQLHVDIVNLDPGIPFTAARARNEGFSKLIKENKGIEFVQFIDGDCELNEEWMQHASDFLIENPEVAIVCGRLREKYPDKSIYNNLCDIEWAQPEGETKACGGIFLARSGVFLELDGFNNSMIAGEEPELCLRARRNGWKIWRIESEMALHDANMIFFRQWWKRAVRSGYAYALGRSMHGDTKEQHWLKETRRIWIWGFWLPVGIITLSAIQAYFALGLIIYPLQITRIAINSQNKTPKYWKYALFTTVGKFPEMQGLFKFYFTKLLDKKEKIIEHKAN